MSDDQATAGAAPALNPANQGGMPGAGQPGQKSPLDVLEEILRESKDKGGGEPAAPAGPVVGEDGLTDEERAAQQAQREAERERRRQEDALALQQQLQALKAIDQTPQYQARVAQEAQEDQKEAEKAAAIDGFEIFQLKHTKVPVEDQPT